MTLLANLHGVTCQSPDYLDFKMKCLEVLKTFALFNPANNWQSSQ